MRQRGVRLAFAVSATVALAVAGAVLVLHEVALSLLSSEPATFRDHVLGALRDAGMVLVLLGAALGAWVGAGLARPLKRLRHALHERASGDIALPLPATRLTEARRLAHAAERISSTLVRHSARVEEQRRELAVLVDSVSDGLLRLDGSGRIAFLNPAAARLLALPEGVLGQRFTALVRDVELRRLIDRVHESLAAVRTEVTIGERRLLVSVHPVRDDGEEPSGLVVALTDLTELRRLEGVRRDFVANVSHELKTPLTSILGYLETVLNDEPSAELRTQFLEVARRNAQRLQGIVDDLLDLARVESGSWHPEAQELAVRELIQDAWQSCEARAREQQVEFRSADLPVRVLADRGAMGQVLDNLFDNALRHTPPGGRIEVRVQRVTVSGVPWVRFDVSDTGSGIPRDALPRVFERFYRVDPARSRAAGGTGLGLAIVKHLVESMGGEVSADSELGKGTTISFRLPAP